MALPGQVRKVSLPSTCCTRIILCVLRRFVRYAPLLMAALAFLARLVPGPRTIDDAFITFRYARNLLGGLGFVFNAGERVLGTTTPLYTLLLAALAGLTRVDDFPWLALWLNALADALRLCPG